MKPIFSLPHRFSRVGIIIAALGLILVVLRKQFQLASLSYLQQSLLAHAILCCGLVIYIFAGEKVEDEFIDRLRLESFRFSLLLTFLFIIAGLAFEILRPGVYQTTVDVIIFQALAYIICFRYLLRRFGNSEKNEKSN